MDGRQTKGSDCFALGMVIYEVLSGKRPFATDKDSVIARMILDGHRPRRPQGKEGGLFTDVIWGALELCWKDQPQDRISVSAILRPLEGHPPLLRPSPDADAETGSDDQSDVGSGMFFPSYPWPTFNHPCTIAGSFSDDGPPSPQTANPRGGWLERTWEMFETTTRKLQGL
jgi:serine/threonine protein kinase